MPRLLHALIAAVALAIGAAASSGAPAAASDSGRVELSTPGGVTISLKPADGSFTVLVDGTVWLETAKDGPARVYDRGTM